MMKGTSFYMAPEIIKTESYDSKVDIWSMGCITMEMWTAKRPWDNVNNPVTIFIKVTRYPFHDNIPIYDKLSS